LLGIRPLPITRDLVAQCIADLRETETVYLDEGLAHPVIIARTGNWALNHNVVLGPWMHVGSKLQHFVAAHIGDELSVRAVITSVKAIVSSMSTCWCWPISTRCSRG